MITIIISLIIMKIIMPYALWRNKRKKRNSTSKSERKRKMIIIIKIIINLLSSASQSIDSASGCRINFLIFVLNYYYFLNSVCVVFGPRFSVISQLTPEGLDTGDPRWGGQHLGLNLGKHVGKHHGDEPPPCTELLFFFFFSFFFFPSLTLSAPQPSAPFTGKEMFPQWTNVERKKVQTKRARQKTKQNKETEKRKENNDYNHHNHLSHLIVIDCNHPYHFYHRYLYYYMITI